MKLLKFVFNYKKFITKDKRTGREITKYYPMVPCTFSWKDKKSPIIDCLLDSGSDGNVIPLTLAEYFGLDLIPDDTPMKVVGGEVKRYKSGLDLTLGRGGRTISLSNVDVAIPIEGKTPFLIGRNPIFELFEITFIESEKKVVMKPYKTSEEKKKVKKNK